MAACGEGAGTRGRGVLQWDARQCGDGSRVERRLAGSLCVVSSLLDVAGRDCGLRVPGLGRSSGDGIGGCLGCEHLSLSKCPATS